MLIDSPLINLFLKIWVLLQKRFHQMVGLLCGAAHGKWASCMPWMRKCAAKLASYVALGRRLTQHTGTAAPPENNTPIKHTSGCHQHQDNGNSGLTWLASHSRIISMLKMSTTKMKILWSLFGLRICSLHMTADFQKKIKYFVLWLSVPHGTSNFVYPKMILHNRSHVNCTSWDHANHGLYSYD